MFKEFKEFAMKGNIMDLAIGVVIGGAFQAIVNSLVSDIIMPVVSLFTGKIDFTNLKITVENTSINYGNFITAIVNFLIVAFTIFMVIRYLSRMEKMRKEFELGISSKIKLPRKKKKKEEEKEVEVEPENKICPYCLTEIKYKAVRCPHCTSKLEDIKINESEK